MRTTARMPCVLGAAALAAFLPLAAAETAPEFPLITSADLPLYPLAALHARIQGTVKIKVTADRERVTGVELISGPPILAQAARENIMSWHFVMKKSISFMTTYEYVITDPPACEFTNGTTTAHLPERITVSARGLQTCDPGTNATKTPKR